MRQVRLIGYEDEYGGLGLIIKGTPLFEGLMADRDGLSIAHDLLEHQNGLKAMGPVWDELEALGGIWQVRGRTGYLGTASIHSPVVNLASDVSRMFPEWFHNDDTYQGPWKSPKEGTRACDYDEDFLEILEVARKDALEEFASSTDWTDTDREQYGSIEALWEAYAALTLRRMRIGFRKATKRYGHSYAAYDTFTAIREAVKGADCEFEGQEFVLSYVVPKDNRSARAYCEEYYGPEYDYD